MISLRVLPPIPLYPPLFFSVKYLYSSGRERSAKREFFDGNADNCRIHGHTTSSRFSLFSRFSMDSMSRTRCLFPLPFDRAGMNIGNRGTDAGSMLFRCTRFFLVEWKCFTIFFFFFFLFLSFFSLFLFFVLALGVVSERSIEENTSWKERRRGWEKYDSGATSIQFLPSFFCQPAEGGIVDRVERRPLQIRFVGIETRALP